MRQVSRKLGAPQSSRNTPRLAPLIAASLAVQNSRSSRNYARKVMSGRRSLAVQNSRSSRGVERPLSVFCTVTLALAANDSFPTFTMDFWKSD